MQNHDEPRKQQGWFSRRLGGLQERRRLKHHWDRRLLFGCTKCSEERQGYLHLALLPAQSGGGKSPVNNRRAKGGSDGIHLDDATDPIEIQPPGRDCLIVVLCTEGSGERAPFTSLDDIPLDPNRGAAIVTLVNKQAAE